MKPPKVIAKVLMINKQEQGLVLTRSDSDDSRAGQADFPGGNVDSGETWDQAAVREVLEETNLTTRLEDLVLIRVHTSMKGDENLIRAFYVTRSFTGDIKLSHEHSELEWVDLKEIPSRFHHPGWGESVQYALDNSLL